MAASGCDRVSLLCCCAIGGQSGRPPLYAQGRSLCSKTEALLVLLAVCLILHVHVYTCTS